jgi:hypothetical protein
MRASAPSRIPGWRLWVPGAILAFAASRALLIVAAVGFGQLPDPDLVPPGWPDSIVPSAIAAWDSVYYIGIAKEGYHLQPVVSGFRDWAFFPAFPALLRLASPLTGGDLVLAGMLVSNGALIAALLLAGLAIAEHEDKATTATSQLLIALSPGAVAFGLAYSDSLALAAAAGLYVAARHGHRWIAGLLLAVATLTRPPGILLAIPLAIILWEEADRRDVRATLRLLAPIALGPLALLGFAALQGVTLGDPLAFLHAQADWARPTTRPYPGILSGILAISFAAYTVSAVVLMRSRLPRAAKALGLVAYVSVVVSGRLLSNARYMALGWPIAWMLARQGRIARLATVCLFGVGYLLFAILNLSQHMPP